MVSRVTFALALALACSVAVPVAGGRGGAWGPGKCEKAGRKANRKGCHSFLVTNAAKSCMLEGADGDLRLVLIDVAANSTVFTDPVRSTVPGASERGTSTG